MSESTSPKVILAGGSGFIGGALLRELTSAGYDCVLLSRSATGTRPQTVQWDGKTVGEWVSALEGATAVVNLAGHPVACRWTEENRRLIRESRVASTRAIGEAIQRCAQPPAVWVNTSATGYYGDTGDRPVSEASGPGQGFLSDVGRSWEAAQLEHELPHTRRVRIRVGVVLSRNGGALPRIERFARMFLGGPVGSGRQFMSWIHERDLVALYRFAIERPVEGPLNGTSPHPVRNAEFMATLRAVLVRPPVPPVPAEVFRIISNAMGVEPDLVLDSQRVLPVMTQFHGFEYQFRELRPALENLFST